MFLYSGNGLLRSWTLIRRFSQGIIPKSMFMLMRSTSGMIPAREKKKKEKEKEKEKHILKQEISILVLMTIVYNVFYVQGQ